MKNRFETITVLFTMLCVFGVTYVACAENAAQVDVRISYPCAQGQHPCDTNVAISRATGGDIVNVYITLLDANGDPATTGPLGEGLFTVPAAITSTIGTIGAITPNQFLSDVAVVIFDTPSGVGPAARANIDYTNATPGIDIITVVIPASPDPLIGVANVNVAAAPPFVETLQEGIINVPNTEATDLLIFSEGPQSTNGELIGPAPGGEAIIRVSANGIGTFNRSVQISIGEGSAERVKLRMLNGTPLATPYTSTLTFVPSLKDIRLVLSPPPPAACFEISVTDLSDIPLNPASFEYIPCYIPCKVTISPSHATMSLGETQIFTASTTCNGGSLDGVYTWSVDGGILDTTSGDSVVYTADEGGMFALTVTDTANGNITDTSEVDVFGPCDFFVMVEPGSISRSRWIMLPVWVDIWGVNCNFDLSTRVTYEPKTSVLPMPFLIVAIRHIRQLIFVMPSWFAWAMNETLTVMVTTTEFGMSSDTISVEMLPFPLDEQRGLK